MDRKPTYPHKDTGVKNVEGNMEGMHIIISTTEALRWWLRLMASPCFVFCNVFEEQAKTVRSINDFERRRPTPSVAPLPSEFLCHKSITASRNYRKNASKSRCVIPIRGKKVEVLGRLRYWLYGIDSPCLYLNLRLLFFQEAWHKCSNHPESVWRRYTSSPYS